MVDVLSRELACLVEGSLKTQLRKIFSTALHGWVQHEPALTSCCSNFFSCYHVTKLLVH